jgi:hypothetical protein
MFGSTFSKVEKKIEIIFFVLVSDITQSKTTLKHNQTNMSNKFIVNDRYYSYTVTGALKRITQLCKELDNCEKNDCEKNECEKNECEKNDCKKNDCKKNDRKGDSYLTTEIYDLNDYIDLFAKNYADYLTRRQLIKVCKYRNIIDRLKEKEASNDKIQYYSDEYATFLASIGLKLNDKSQNELLYELLNN